MGTVSQKLEYLNTTKGKIKDSINLTGVNIGSNDTFRSYAVKLRDGLVQVLNDNGETLYNNFPKVSGSGSEITLENTLEAPMKNGTIKGDTLQDGEPTPDYPQEIQSVEGIQNITISDKTDSDSYEVNLEGKNLLDIANPTTIPGNVSFTKINDNTYKYLISSSGQWYNTVLYDIQNILPNTQYTYSFNVNDISLAESKFSRILLDFYDINNNQIGNNYIDNISSTGEYSKTFTTPSNIASIKVRIYIEISTLNIGDYITLSNFIISTSGGEYVPYRSPIKLYNGDYITGTPYNWNIVRNNGVIDSYNGETITTDYISTTGGLDTGATIVYELDTPTTEQITDEYLISQLNALYNAKSYNGQTNITVNGQLPMILEVSALKDEI